MGILGTSSDGPWGLEGHSSDCRTEGSPCRVAAWRAGEAVAGRGSCPQEGRLGRTRHSKTPAWTSGRN